MALKSKSLFLYGYEVTPLNNAIDFQAVSAGPVLMATLRLGFYSLSTMLVEVTRALQEVDPDHNYTVTADRTVLGGTQNRVTIAQQSGTFLSILFNSGPRAITSAAELLGFQAIDYTGAFSYSGSATSGITLSPTYAGYNYLGPEFYRNVFGASNVSASGNKEAIVYAIQQFVQVQFKFEPMTFWITDWLPLFDWLIQQRPFDFTPEISNPTVSYPCTLEMTAEDGKGMGIRPDEMLPQYPFNYDTGTLKFRVILL